MTMTTEPALEDVQRRARILVQLHYRDYLRAMTRAWAEGEDRRYWLIDASRARYRAADAAWVLAGWYAR